MMRPYFIYQNDLGKACKLIEQLLGMHFPLVLFDMFQKNYELQVYRPNPQKLHPKLGKFARIRKYS
jgi:hypothetical protein